jgi:hypothetical protein
VSSDKPSKISLVIFSVFVFAKKPKILLLRKTQPCFGNNFLSSDIFGNVGKRCSQSRSLKNFKNQASVGVQELKIGKARADGKKACQMSSRCALIYTPSALQV